MIFVITHPRNNATTEELIDDIKFSARDFSFFVSVGIRNPTINAIPIAIGIDSVGNPNVGTINQPHNIEKVNPRKSVTAITLLTVKTKATSVAIILDFSVSVKN